MEKNKLNELKNYYMLSKAFVATDEDEAFSTIWCREASQVILDLIEELQELAEYEYALQWTHVPSGISGRLYAWGKEGWGSEAEARAEHRSQKEREAEAGVADDYTYKLLKRRLRGGIETVQGGI